MEIQIPQYYNILLLERLSDLFLKARVLELSQSLHNLRELVLSNLVLLLVSGEMSGDHDQIACIGDDQALTLEKDFEGKFREDGHADPS